MNIPIADQIAVCLSRVPSKNGTIILRNISIADQIAVCLCQVSFKNGTIMLKNINIADQIAVCLCRVSSKNGNNNFEEHSHSRSNCFLFMSSTF